MSTQKMFAPVFRLSGTGNVGIWSIPQNHFSASLLGIVRAEISYPDNVEFYVDDEKLNLLEKKKLPSFTDLHIRESWALHPRDGIQPEGLLEQFCQEYPKKWKRISKISDWLLSLPLSEFKKTGLSSDMWA